MQRYQVATLFGLSLLCVVAAACGSITGAIVTFGVMSAALVLWCCGEEE